jgi:oxygen-dependent protoporphyrinogen oxidase
VICSERRDEYLLELGPQSFSGTAALRTLCADLGIADQLVQAPPRAPRYVLINGCLKAVPLNPASLLTSSLLSSATKWRIARDVFGSSRPPEHDESVGAFVRRKFGDELLDRLVGPFVSGIYAGDPERLSFRAAFPQLYAAEKSAGSVIRGTLRAGKASKHPRERPTLLSFRDGSDTLVQALARKIGACLHLETEAIAVAERRAAGNCQFELRIRKGSSEQVLAASQLVLAAPAGICGALLRDINPAFEAVLTGIDYAPVAVVSLGYRREHVGHSLDGFGFLAPRSSGLRVLGCVWNSSLFPDRAPTAHVLMTSFVGGATDPNAAALLPEELIALVHRELKPILQIRGGPEFSHVQGYPRALPQYNVGHSERMIELERLRSQHPALFFVGNYLHGAAVGTCIELALATAQRIAIHVKVPNPQPL